MFVIYEQLARFSLWLPAHCYLRATCSILIAAPYALLFTSNLLEPHCGSPTQMYKFKLPTNDNVKAAAVRSSEVEEHFTGYLV